jgi:hypothetical protein
MGLLAYFAFKWFVAYCCKWWNEQNKDENFKN